MPIDSDKLISGGGGAGGVTPNYFVGGVGGGGAGGIGNGGAGGGFLPDDMEEEDDDSTVFYSEYGNLPGDEIKFIYNSYTKWCVYNQDVVTMLSNGSTSYGVLEVFPGSAEGTCYFNGSNDNMAYKKFEDNFPQECGEWPCSRWIEKKIDSNPGNHFSLDDTSSYQTVELDLDESFVTDDTTYHYFAPELGWQSCSGDEVDNVDNQYRNLDGYGKYPVPMYEEYNRGASAIIFLTPDHPQYSQFKKQLQEQKNGKLIAQHFPDYEYRIYWGHLDKICLLRVYHAVDNDQQRQQQDQECIDWIINILGDHYNTVEIDLDESLQSGSVEYCYAYSDELGWQFTPYDYSSNYDQFIQKYKNCSNYGVYFTKGSSGNILGLLHINDDNPQNLPKLSDTYNSDCDISDYPDHGNGTTFIRTYRYGNTIPVSQQICDTRQWIENAINNIYQTVELDLDEDLVTDNYNHPQGKRYKVGASKAACIIRTIKRQNPPYDWSYDNIVYKNSSGRYYIVIYTDGNSYFDWLSMYGPTESDFDLGEIYLDLKVRGYTFVNGDCEDCNYKEVELDLDESAFLDNNGFWVMYSEELGWSSAPSTQYTSLLKRYSDCLGYGKYYYNEYMDHVFGKIVLNPDHPLYDVCRQNPNSFCSLTDLYTDSINTEYQGIVVLSRSYLSYLDISVDEQVLQMRHWIEDTLQYNYPTVELDLDENYYNMEEVWECYTPEKGWYTDYDRSIISKCLENDVTGGMRYLSSYVNYEGITSWSVCARVVISTQDPIYSQYSTFDESVFPKSKLFDIHYLDNNKGKCIVIMIDCHKKFNSKEQAQQPYDEVAQLVEDILQRYQRVELDLDESLEEERWECYTPEKGWYFDKNRFVVTDSCKIPTLIGVKFYKKYSDHDYTVSSRIIIPKDNDLYSYYKSQFKGDHKSRVEGNYVIEGVSYSTYFFIYCNCENFYTNQQDAEQAYFDMGLWVEQMMNIYNTVELDLDESYSDTDSDLTADEMYYTQETGWVKGTYNNTYNDTSYATLNISPMFKNICVDVIIQKDHPMYNTYIGKCENGTDEEYENYYIYYAMDVSGTIVLQRCYYTTTDEDVRQLYLQEAKEWVESILGVQYNTVELDLDESLITVVWSFYNNELGWRCCDRTNFRAVSEMYKHGSSYGKYSVHANEYRGINGCVKLTPQHPLYNDFKQQLDDDITEFTYLKYEDTMFLDNDNIIIGRDYVDSHNDTEKQQQIKDIRQWIETILTVDPYQTVELDLDESSSNSKYQPQWIRQYYKPETGWVDGIYNEFSDTFGAISVSMIYKNIIAQLIIQPDHPLYDDYKDLITSGNTYQSESDDYCMYVTKHDNGMLVVERWYYGYGSEYTRNVYIQEAKEWVENNLGNRYNTVELDLDEDLNCTYPAMTTELYTPEEGWKIFSSSRYRPDGTKTEGYVNITFVKKWKQWNISGSIFIQPDSALYNKYITYCTGEGSKEYDLYDQGYYLDGPNSYIIIVRDYVVTEDDEEAQNFVTDCKQWIEDTLGYSSVELDLDEEYSYKYKWCEGEYTEQELSELIDKLPSNFSYGLSYDSIRCGGLFPFQFAQDLVRDNWVVKPDPLTCKDMYTIFFALKDDTCITLFSRYSDKEDIATYILPKEPRDNYQTVELDLDESVTSINKEYYTSYTGWVNYFCSSFHEHTYGCIKGPITSFNGKSNLVARVYLKPDHPRYKDYEYKAEMDYYKEESNFYYNIRFIFLNGDPSNTDYILLEKVYEDTYDIQQIKDWVEELVGVSYSEVELDLDESMSPIKFLENLTVDNSILSKDGYLWQRFERDKDWYKPTNTDLPYTTFGSRQISFSSTTINVSGSVFLFKNDPGFNKYISEDDYSITGPNYEETVTVCQSGSAFPYVYVIRDYNITKDPQEARDMLEDVTNWVEEMIMGSYKNVELDLDESVGNSISSLDIKYCTQSGWQNFLPDASESYGLLELTSARSLNGISGWRVFAEIFITKEHPNYNSLYDKCVSCIMLNDKDYYTCYDLFDDEDEESPLCITRRYKVVWDEGVSKYIIEDCEEFIEDIVSYVPDKYDTVELDLDEELLLESDYWVCQEFYTQDLGWRPYDFQKVLSLQRHVPVAVVRTRERYSTYDLETTYYCSATITIPHFLTNGCDYKNQNVILSKAKNNVKETLGETLVHYHILNQLASGECQVCVELENKTVTDANVAQTIYDQTKVNIQTILDDYGFYTAVELDLDESLDSEDAVTEQIYLPGDGWTTDTQQIDYTKTFGIVTAMKGFSSDLWFVRGIIIIQPNHELYDSFMDYAEEGYSKYHDNYELYYSVGIKGAYVTSTRHYYPVPDIKDVNDFVQQCKNWIEDKLNVFSTVALDLDESYNHSVYPYGETYDLYTRQDGWNYHITDDDCDTLDITFGRVFNAIGQDGCNQVCCIIKICQDCYHYEEAKNLSTQGIISQNNYVDFYWKSIISPDYVILRRAYIKTYDEHTAENYVQQCRNFVQQYVDAEPNSYEPVQLDLDESMLDRIYYLYNSELGWTSCDKDNLVNIIKGYEVFPFYGIFDVPRDEYRGISGNLVFTPQHPLYNTYKLQLSNPEYVCWNFTQDIFLEDDNIIIQRYYNVPSNAMQRQRYIEDIRDWIQYAEDESSYTTVELDLDESLDKDDTYDKVEFKHALFKYLRNCEPGDKLYFTDNSSPVYFITDLDCAIKTDEGWQCGSDYAFTGLAADKESDEDLVNDILFCMAMGYSFQITETKPMTNSQFVDYIIDHAANYTDIELDLDEDFTYKIGNIDGKYSEQELINLINKLPQCLFYGLKDNCIRCGGITPMELVRFLEIYNWIIDSDSTDLIATKDGTSIIVFDKENDAPVPECFILPYDYTEPYETVELDLDESLNATLEKYSFTEEEGWKQQDEDWSGVNYFTDKTTIGAELFIKKYKSTDHCWVQAFVVLPEGTELYEKYDRILKGENDTWGSITKDYIESGYYSPRYTYESLHKFIILKISNKLGTSSRSELQNYKQHCIEWIMDILGSAQQYTTVELDLDESVTDKDMKECYTPEDGWYICYDDFVATDFCEKERTAGVKFLELYGIPTKHWEVCGRIIISPDNPLYCKYEDKCFNGSRSIIGNFDVHFLTFGTCLVLCLEHKTKFDSKEQALPIYMEMGSTIESILQPPYETVELDLDEAFSDKTLYYCTTSGKWCSNSPNDDTSYGRLNINEKYDNIDILIYIYKDSPIYNMYEPYVGYEIQEEDSVTQFGINIYHTIIIHKIYHLNNVLDKQQLIKQAKNWVEDILGYPSVELDLEEAFSLPSYKREDGYYLYIPCKGWKQSSSAFNLSEIKSYGLICITNNCVCFKVRFPGTYSEVQSWIEKDGIYPLSVGYKDVQVTYDKKNEYVEYCTYFKCYDGERFYGEDLQHYFQVAVDDIQHIFNNTYQTVELDLDESFNTHAICLYSEPKGWKCYTNSNYPDMEINYLLLHSIDFAKIMYEDKYLIGSVFLITEDKTLAHYFMDAYSCDPEFYCSEMYDSKHNFIRIDLTVDVYNMTDSDRSFYFQMMKSALQKLITDFTEFQLKKDSSAYETVELDLDESLDDVEFEKDLLEYLRNRQCGDKLYFTDINCASVDCITDLDYIIKTSDGWSCTHDDMPVGDTQSDEELVDNILFFLDMDYSFQIEQSEPMTKSQFVNYIKEHAPDYDTVELDLDESLSKPGPYGGIYTVEDGWIALDRATSFLGPMSKNFKQHINQGLLQRYREAIKTFMFIYAPSDKEDLIPHDTEVIQDGNLWIEERISLNNSEYYYVERIYYFDEDDINKQFYIDKAKQDVQDTVNPPVYKSVELDLDESLQTTEQLSFDALQSILPSKWIYGKDFNISRLSLASQDVMLRGVTMAQFLSDLHEDGWVDTENPQEESFDYCMYNKDEDVIIGIRDDDKEGIRIIHYIPTKYQTVELDLDESYDSPKTYYMQDTGWIPSVNMGNFINSPDYIYGSFWYTETNELCAYCQLTPDSPLYDKYLPKASSSLHYTAVSEGCEERVESDFMLENKKCLVVYRRYNAYCLNRLEDCKKWIEDTIDGVSYSEVELDLDESYKVLAMPNMDENTIESMEQIAKIIEDNKQNFNFKIETIRVRPYDSEVVEDKGILIALWYDSPVSSTEENIKLLSDNQQILKQLLQKFGIQDKYILTSSNSLTTCAVINTDLETARLKEIELELQECKN